MNPFDIRCIYVGTKCDGYAGLTVHKISQMLNTWALPNCDTLPEHP